MTTATNFRENETASFAAVISATASKKGIELQVPPPVVPPTPAASKSSPRPVEHTILDAIGSAERVAMLIKYIYGQLEAASNPLADVAWVVLQEASRSAESMGEAIGVEVLCN